MIAAAARCDVSGSDTRQASNRGSPLSSLDLSGMSRSFNPVPGLLERNRPAGA